MHEKWEDWSFFQKPKHQVAVAIVYHLEGWEKDTKLIYLKILNCWNSVIFFHRAKLLSNSEMTDLDPKKTVDVCFFYLSRLDV